MVIIYMESVSVSSGQNTGWYDLEVYDQNTGNWVQKNSAFYVNYTAPVAQINSISPNSGRSGTNPVSYH